MSDEESDKKAIEETDERFPSGPWIGYFLQREVPGRHWMDLTLRFREGHIEGAGTDWVGRFLVNGTYRVQDGVCAMGKHYLGKHKVDYRGFNEGRGIWGTWQIPPFFQGGFHIWPKAMGDLSQPTLDESLELPVEEPILAVTDEPV